jgi:glucose/arabinose dehydrogenase
MRSCSFGARTGGTHRQNAAIGSTAAQSEHMTRTATSSLLAAILLLSVAAPVAARPSAPATAEAQAGEAAFSGGMVDIQLVVSGLTQPIGVVNAGDGTNRLFVVQQNGIVRVVANNRLVSGSFLDIRGVTGGFTTGGERGLLGLAFHPDFETNRRLYVNYTNGSGNTVIAEFTANAGRTAASVATRRVLDSFTQPFSNHNGGQLAFGPDGWLYVFMGDGGSGGDPNNYAQNDASPLGKILRMSPDTGAYTHWAKGLRNPWRASFDMGAATPQLWIADVGQGSREEINRVNATAAGVNYGWSLCEGTARFKGSGSCTSGGLTGPIAEYGHTGGNCSVTGGVVYRGSIQEDFIGQYVLGDYCSGRIWTISAGGSSLLFHRDTGALITSFGAAENGEVYMTDHGGRLYRVVAPPFSDITSHGFFNEILWLYYEGITGGCGGGRFCPNGTVTREQMASFLARALRLPATTQDFFDDDEASQHEGDINRLAAAGITGGCDTDRFCPRANVTRAQMASFLVRAFKLPASSTDSFTDDEGNIHENSINALARSGITGGCDAARYCPNAFVTRGQMAAFLERAHR